MVSSFLGVVILSVGLFLLVTLVGYVVFGDSQA
jgi:hypothetical protein